MSAKVLSGVVPEVNLKRVLRHRGSNVYFKNGSWTENPEEADSFNDVVEVAETCARYGLSDVEVAIRFKSGNCDVFCTQIR